MLLASSRAVVNVLDAAEETSREVQKGEAEATSKQCLYFLKSVGIKNKKKKKRDDDSKAGKFFLDFLYLGHVSGETEKYSQYLNRALCKTL